MPLLTSCFYLLLGLPPSVSPMLLCLPSPTCAVLLLMSRALSLFQKESIPLFSISLWAGLGDVIEEVRYPTTALPLFTSAVPKADASVLPDVCLCRTDTDVFVFVFLVYVC